MSVITLPIMNDPITTPNAVETAITAIFNMNASIRAFTGTGVPFLDLFFMSSPIGNIVMSI